MRKNKRQGEVQQDFALDGYSVRLTAWHARQARKLSKSNELGDGVRLAIELAVKTNERER